jgi:nucleotide-binding universal stress UspA family protein
MYKDILVNLSLAEDRDPACDYAASLATAFDAHITGVAFRYEPVIAPTVMGGLPPEVIEDQIAESEQSARAAVARFEMATAGPGAKTEALVMDATFTGAGTAFGRLARRFDLSVVGQPGPDKNVVDGVVAEGALFESGRPLVMVPFIQREPFAVDRIMVCWDGSRTAARALGDAMPLIMRAKQVEVVMAATSGKEGELPGAGLGAHLARHGANVEIKRIVVTDGDVANALLSYSADYGAHLIVMGGYGHSRLREFVLGGVTRAILASMTVPTLLSH